MAKDQNVRLRSGWFSERDACYLATGKPVIAQSTGLRERAAHRRRAVRVPRPWTTSLAAIDTIESDYAARLPRGARGGRGVPRGHARVPASFVEDIGL